MAIFYGTTGALGLTALQYLAPDEEDEVATIHGCTPGMTIPARYLPMEPREYVPVFIFPEARVHADERYPDLEFMFTCLNQNGLNFVISHKENRIGYAQLKENKLTLTLLDGTEVADLETLHRHIPKDAS